MCEIYSGSFLLSSVFQDDSKNLKGLIRAMIEPHRATEDRHENVVLLHSTDGLNRSWAVWIIFALLVSGEQPLVMDMFVCLASKFPVSLDRRCIGWVSELLRRVPIDVINLLIDECKGAKVVLEGSQSERCVLQ